MGSVAEIAIRVVLHDAASQGLAALKQGILGLSVLGGLAAAFGLFAVAIAYSVAQFAMLQTAMNTVQIATGATAAQIKILQTFMIGLGSTAIFSLSQLAQGMAIVAQFGFKTVAALEAVTNAGVILGEALNTTPTVAFELLAKTMRNFSIPAAQAQQTADLLFYSFQHGSNNISQLEAGFGQLGGIAQLLHIKLADLIPAFDLLSPIMGSAALAGNALYFGLARLANPTISEAALQKQLGLSFFTSTGQFIGFNQALAELYNKLKDKSPEDQFKILSDLMSVRGAKAFELLIGKYKDYQKAVAQFIKDNQGAGQSEKAAELVTNSLAGQFKILQSNISDAAAYIGQAFGPAITNFLKWINNAIVGLRQFATVNGEALARFLLIGAALAGLALIIGIALSPLGAIVGIILLVVAAVIGLAAGITYLSLRWNEWMKANTAVGATMRNVGAAMSALGTWISSVLVPALINLYNWLAPKVGAAFSAIGLMLTTRVGPAFSALGTFVQGAITIFKELWNWVQTQLLPALSRLWTFLTSNLGPAFSALGVFVQGTLVPAIKTLWSVIATQLWPALQQLWSVIATQVWPILVQLWNVISTQLWPALQKLWSIIGGPVMAALTQLWNLLKLIAPFIGIVLVVAIGLFIIALTLVIVIVTAVILIITGLIHVIAGVIGGIATFVGNTLATLGHWKNVIGQIIAGVVNWFQRLPGNIQAVFNNAGTWLNNAGQRIIQGLIDGINSKWNDLTNAIGNAAQIIRSHLPFSPVEVGPLVGVEFSGLKLMQMVADGINQGAPIVQSAMDRALGGVSGGISSVPGMAGYGAGYGNIGGNITVPVVIDGRVITEVVINRITGQLQSNGMSRAFR